MSEQELAVVHWYRSLSALEQLSVDAWLAGDDWLLDWLWPFSPALQQYRFIASVQT